MKLKLLRNVLRDLRRYLKHEDMYLGAMALGMNSSTDFENDKHMLFLDYDITDEQLVESSICELQAMFSLSHCYIYKTVKGFHAFFFYDNDLPYSRIRLIINYAKDVDNMFRYISKYYDHKTIRVAGKYKEQDIEFYKVVYSNVRMPSLQEIEVAEAKRSEYKALKKLHGMFEKSKLKDNELKDNDESKNKGKA